jgi:hypothetical protein
MGQRTSAQRSGHVDTARAPHRKTTRAENPICVVYRPIKALKLDPANARQHSNKQILQIAQSINAFGFNVPVLIDAELNVIAGHGRLLACRKLGWQEVPTISLSHLNETQASAFALADTQKEGPWQTYPRRMLTMRARSWALRDGFADVLRGLSIREEVDDYDPVVAASPRPEFANRSVAPFRQPIARPRFADYLSARSTAGPQARCRGGLCVDHGHAENAAAIADIISPNVIGAAETSARSMDPAPLGGANKLPAPADEGRTRENLSGATDGVAACPTDKQKDTGIEPLKVWPNADAAVADDLSVSAAYALVDADGNFIEVGTLAALPEAFDRLITEPHLSAARVVGLWESNALAREEIERAFGATALADADSRRQSAELEKVDGAAEQRSSRAIASIQTRRNKTRNAATAKLEFDPACGNEEFFQLYRSRLLRLKRRRAKAAAFTDFRHANSASETRLREQVPDRMAEIDALYRWAAAHAS